MQLRLGNALSRLLFSHWRHHLFYLKPPFDGIRIKTKTKTRKTKKNLVVQTNPRKSVFSSKINGFMTPINFPYTIVLFMLHIWTCVYARIWEVGECTYVCAAEHAFIIWKNIIFYFIVLFIIIIIFVCDMMWPRLQQQQHTISSVQFSMYYTIYICMFIVQW